MVSTNRLTPQTNPETSTEATILAVKYPLEIEPTELTPREFCRKMHGLADLPEVEILRAEMDIDYRKKCIELLTKVLGVKRQSVHNWGGAGRNYVYPISRTEAATSYPTGRRRQHELEAIQPRRMPRLRRC